VVCVWESDLKREEAEDVRKKGGSGFRLGTFIAQVRRLQAELEVRAREARLGRREGDARREAGGGAS